MHGTTAVIGAYIDSDLGYSSGSAYVFSETSPGNWAQVAKLLASDGAAQDQFGYSVAVSNTTLLVGANGKETAYFFTSDADACISSPCLNLGVCTSNDICGASFACNCTSTGWEGTECQTDVDECASSPCENGGTCSDGDGTGVYACDCTSTGWEGTECQTEIDECASSPCQNDGVCSDFLGNFSCDCTDTGYEGLTCSGDIDDCLSSPCQNDGVCQDKGANKFQCTCNAYWEGNTCADNVNDCLLTVNECLNGGGCTDDPVNLGDVICDCSTADTFTGKYCDLPIEDACVVVNPCLHGGQCVLDDITGEMSCDCTDTGYEGDTCEVQVYVSECVSSPCLNEGQCYDPSDYQDDWYCVCVNGYFGDICDVTACDSMPCANGGTCTVSNDDEPSGHTCACPENFSGAQCQVNAAPSNPCLSAPCTDRQECRFSSDNTSYSCVVFVIVTASFEDQICPTDVDCGASNAPELLEAHFVTVLSQSMGGEASDFEVTVMLHDDGTYDIEIVFTDAEGQFAAGGSQQFVDAIVAGDNGLVALRDGWDSSSVDNSAALLHNLQPMMVVFLCLLSFIMM